MGAVVTADNAGGVNEQPANGGPPRLYLHFHGRVLEHLGIQMYQRPVNAIAELVANGWDADSANVWITLPPTIDPTAEVVVKDDGVGMTLEECQAHFLKVGRNRRGNDPDAVTAELGRPVLGRKGIGKFAGFGIARVITIDTTSKATGERTVFRLELARLAGDEYKFEGEPVEVVSYDAPDEARKAASGTKFTLSSLTLKQTRNPTDFARSMARRFLLLEQQAGFHVSVNDLPMPTDEALTGVEFSFPRDYFDSEKPADLTAVDADGWGTETISGGHTIKWRFQFLRDTIDEEELRGISVFVKVKLGQAPFLFNVTGGLRGQHGVEYLVGQVKADYLDALGEDLISTERQRINWEHEAAEPLLKWGQDRVRTLLSIWADRRSQTREKALEERVAGFADRLGRLQGFEKKTVKKALRQLAKIPTLSDDQFESLGRAILTAWEQGRLQELVSEIGDAQDMTEAKLLSILAEANVLSALNTAEAVKAKLAVIENVEERRRNRQLENAVRDYIAHNPWLINPVWETFKKEIGVDNLIHAAAEESRWLDADVYNGRVDLTMASGTQLLILEFMRPGLRLDWDHVSRFERYVLTLCSRIEGNNQGRFRSVTGIVVADDLDRTPEMLAKLNQLKLNGMMAMDWETLLNEARAQWKEFLVTLGERQPADERLAEAVAPSVIAPARVQEINPQPGVEAA